LDGHGHPKMTTWILLLDLATSPASALSVSNDDGCMGLKVSTRDIHVHVHIYIAALTVRPVGPRIREKVSWGTRWGVLA
jgi:hypothetical protein